MLLEDYAPASASIHDAVDAYESLLGCGVVLVRNVQLARRLVLASATIGAGDSVAVPANASRNLVGTIMQSGATPLFAGLDASLQLEGGLNARALWAQPVAGLPI